MPRRPKTTAVRGLRRLFPGDDDPTLPCASVDELDAGRPEGSLAKAA